MGTLFALRGEMVWALNYHCCMLLTLLVFLILLILTRGANTFSGGDPKTLFLNTLIALCSEMVESFFALGGILVTKLSFLHVAHTHAV